MAKTNRKYKEEVLKVYLAEINEEVLRKRLKEEGHDEGYTAGHEVGITEGISIGNQNRLIPQITKKIKAGKPLEQIADEVEETVDAIAELYHNIKTELEKET